VPTPVLLLKTATATVAGKPEAIITNPQGFTLYYYLPDKGAGKVTCVAACLQAWPPLLVPTGAVGPAAAPGVTGTVGTVANPNGGFQVTYNGWPLYTWTKDTGPGMTTGQNVGAKWFVATPAVPPA
jgi:predicted lipoprotein with Yx(FWY)xxD motif